MPNVISAHVERRVFPLKQPYVTSLCTLDAFDGLLLYISLDNGETRIGEVVPLRGYSSESPEDILHKLESWLPHLIGQKKGAKNSMKTKILGIAGSLRNARWGKGNHLKIKISAQTPKGGG
jgi:O-succinylbenzoate synthase